MLRNIEPIGGFHYGLFILNWVVVNLKSIVNYTAQEWASDSELHIFAIKHKDDIYSKHFTLSNDCDSI